MKTYLPLFICLMAISCDPGQVIDFCELDVVSCECTDDKYCIKVEQTDVTQFQLSLSEVDGAELVTDGAFSAACGVNWTCGGAWAIGSGVASLTLAAVSTLEQTLAASLDLDTYYRIDFDYLNAASNQLDVIFGGNNIAASILIPNPGGSKSLYWYLDSKTNDKIQFEGLGTFSIDNVSIKKISLPDDFTIKDDDGNTVYTFSYTTVTQSNINTPITNKSQHTLTDGAPAKATIETVESRSLITINWGRLGLAAGCYVIDLTTFESRCFKLQTNHLCTLEFSFTNSVNAFGLNFEDFAFTQYLRVDARLRNPRYQYNEKIFTDGSGSHTLTYARKTKVQQLDTEPLPRDLHAALCRGFLMDDFQIDGVRFVREISEISPSWNKNYALAPFQGEVKEASQPNQVNRLC